MNLNKCKCGSSDVDIDHYFGDGGLWWRITCRECLAMSIMSGDQDTVVRDWNERNGVPHATEVAD